MAGSTVANLVEGHNGEVVGDTRVEASDVSHLNCTVDNLHTITCIEEAWLLVRDPIPCDGGIVIVGFLPHQSDAM